eukprot:10850316-Alexandrium_andersonii.AAC.1
MTGPAFATVEQREWPRKHGLLAAGRAHERSHELAELLSVCDAKSLFDHLNSKRQDARLTGGPP